MSYSEATAETNNQARPYKWVGTFQVQLMNSGIYTQFVSITMMMLTFWYTAGYPIRDKYFPWLNMWEFIGTLAVVIWVVIPYLDYKFILPSRQAFINEQSLKHNNEAMNKINQLAEDMKKVKTKMGIND